LIKEQTMVFMLGPRRGTYLDIMEELKHGEAPISSEQVQLLENFDLIYRSLCTMLFNYVPASGHPGGSISAGRFVASLLFGAMDYDISRPDREDADLISFAAGHKALGLYSLWAIRNEALRNSCPRKSVSRSVWKTSLDSGGIPSQRRRFLKS
jgi:transketolase